MTFGVVATPFNKRRAEARRLSLQRRPGLAGRQPKIEGYRLRAAMARQIVA